MFHDFVNIRIFTYVKIRLARWVTLILDKLDIKGIEGVLCNVKYLFYYTLSLGEEEKVLISHTARSFTKLNFCVCIGWSSDYYCALRGLLPKISCVLYNIICNEAKCI